MSPTCCAEEPATDLGAASPRICPRCGAWLRRSNAGELCDPCADLVASCAPFVSEGKLREPAPAHVNLVELVAGLMLTHDALHPGEPLYLQDALAAHGVVADNVDVQHAILKLKNRHGLVIAGRPRVPGYSVRAWNWSATRIRSTVQRCRPLPQPDAADDTAAI